MEKVHYAGDIVFTGTDISRALLAYAQALAQNGASATVDIPVYHEDGSLSRAEFLIGPASQVVSDSVETEWDEIIDADKVRELEEQTRLLGAPKVHPVPYSATSGDDLQFPDFGDI